MRIHIRTALTIHLLLAFTCAAVAQQESTLHMFSGEEVEGEIVSISEDSLIIEQEISWYSPERFESRTRLSIPVKDVRSVTTGDSPSIFGSTAAGFGVGVVVGLIGGMIYGNIVSDGSKYDALVNGGAFFAVTADAGMFIGLLYGIFSEGDKQHFDYTRPKDREALKRQLGMEDENAESSALPESGAR